MKKVAIVVAVAATLVMAGCSTVENVYTKLVPNTEEAVTTPLPDVVIIEEAIPVVEEAPAVE